MRLTGHAESSRNARPPRAGAARVGRRGDHGQGIDRGTHRFVVAIFNAFVILIVLALLVLVVAMMFWVVRANGQVLVSMHRADPAAGMQQIECILVHRDDAATIATGAVLIDCMGDAESIFHNGFEGVPDEAP